MDDRNNNDIAIVGMAIRVPGAATPEQFWANLAAGIESVQTYTDEELLARGVAPSTLANPNYVRAGIPLENVDQFDPEFFGFSPKEGAILDPQHRHFYEAAWEALERAGHPPATFPGAIGVFAGCGMGAYFTFNLLSNPDLVDTVGLFLLRHTGNDKDFLATRVSYAFNLKGPSVNVQNACSTSLVATHLAVQSLLSGECDMALAGGVTIEIPHRVGYVYREGEVLSPDGHCRTFDQRSRGTVFGSGAGVVVLRRLADALADGDHIHAVIKGSAINNDGSSKVGYLAPSVDGQAAAVAEALAVADVSADSIGYVECHGTATPVGDPIEIAALTRAFRESTTRTGFCRIGSVKTNIGHLDTAAGVASLIKAALALEHAQIPPSLNFEAPNPVIDFANSPFTVAAALTEWRRGSQPRRACVNSLGVGGTNAFVVLEEAPAPPAKPAEDAKPQLLALSARNRRSLDDMSKRLAKWLRENHARPLADIAYTLRVGRHGFEQRRVLAATTHDEAAALLESGDPRRVYTHVSDVEHPSLVFMYPGGGAQYFRMGRGLYESEPTFREHVDRGLATLKSRFKTDLAPIFFAPDAQRDEVAKLLAQPANQLPLTFIVEYALTKLWEEYGVKPDAVVGHSMGENTAACVAGVFSFDDALGLLLLRGQLVEQAPPGGMLSVPMPAAELRRLIGNDLDIAASNSPALSVASGTRDALDKLAQRLTESRVEWQHVKVSVAAHSRLLDGVLEQFRRYLSSIELNEPQIPIISNRTGKWLDAAVARDPGYWTEHLRNTVLFAEGVETLLKEQDRVFLEVGPGNMLSSFVRQQPAAPAQRVLSSMRHPEDTSGDETYFRAAAGRLWAVGVELNLEKLHPGEHRRIPLPTYAFQHARYWIEPTAGVVAARKEVNRPVRLADTKDWLFEPRWVQQGLLAEPTEVKSKWLVFDAGDPVIAALVGRLRQQGHTVVTVIAADAYARLESHRYSIAPEAGGAGYQELIEELAANDLWPDRVLHGWLLTRDRSFRPGSSFLHRNQEYGFYSLFHLARAFGKADPEARSLHWVVLTNGTTRVASEAVPYPDKATVLGPYAVVPREFPNITCALVDLELGDGNGAKKKNGSGGSHVDGAVLDRLEAELWAPPATSLTAWRSDVRWQRHIARLRPSSSTTSVRAKLRERGVYLITGGLGGIGGEIATWLAKEYRARLVLIGRTPLPARDDWDHWLAQHESSDTISRAITKILELESLGADVLAAPADVTVAETMQQAVAETRAAFGEINGVIHAAGVIRDNLIQLKSQRDIEEVFSAKVYGTLVLDEIFRRQPLDFMVLFSSTSAFVAPQGQVDYVGASAFVNAFADSCQGSRPYPVTAIAWGIWRDVGMAAPPRPLSTAAALDDAMAHASAVPCSYPLFESHHASHEGLAEQHVFAGTLSAERHWVIDEHRLGTGEALLPGTGYIELVRAALAEIGHAGPWELGNLVFQNPLFVADGAPRDYRVRLRGDERRWDVSVFARRAGTKTPEGWEECASAKVSAVVRDAPSPLELAAADARIEGSSTSAAGSGRLRSRQEDHLKFGPRWQVLTQQKVGRSEALAHLKLPEAHAGDVDTYGLHPGLLDIATGYAMDLIPGYGDQEVPENLWVPISYRAVRFYRTLPAEVVSSVTINKRSSVESGFAAFDVLITDTEGTPLVEVEGLTLRRTDGVLRAPAAPAAAQSVEGEPLAPLPKPLSPAEEALKHNVTQGITVKDGLAALHGILSRPMPATVIASSMNMADLLAQADALSQATSRSSETRFARPELDSDFEAPRDEIEKSLADLWGKLLGVEGVGIKDSFFDLGGHSLIAVRLFNEIADRWSMDLPMSVLMQSPNIASLAELIRGSAHVEGQPGTASAPSAANATPALRFRHIVPMHTGSVADGTPLFVVAGMFGNVLNLSHLAHLLGEDRPFYALQARGLYGDAEPHETFEEAATDYLAELRQVQAHGPYLLGGFSGGGLIAFELARQLMAQGERVLTILMLDTPVRVPYSFTLGERVSMFRQDLRAKGPKFFADKIRQRIDWEREKRDRMSRTQVAAGDTVHFQSQRIGDAFMRGLSRYRVPIVDVNVAVFRPKLTVRYRLSRGRMVDGERNFISPDNFWTPHVGKLTVFEVPGNHDSMVLEPNVRVLVSQMKRVIDQVERAPPAGRAKTESAPRPAIETHAGVAANTLSWRAAE